MHLKLEELQRVVKQTMKEERNYNTLRNELARVLGPSVMVSSNSMRVVEAANERLDVLESTGRSPASESFKLSVLIEAAKSKSISVRKVAARLLPERLASRLLNDPSSEVRCAAAKRLPYRLVKESVMLNPHDDQLRVIARQRKLVEAGVPDPKAVDPHLDIYGEDPLGDAVKTKVGKDMPDTWYERLAHKLVSDYGANLEGQWEETLATRISSSFLATSGVKVDREKLLKMIHKTIKEREDAVIGEGSLSSITKRLLKESYMDDSVMPVIQERDCPVEDLLESSHSSSSYVSSAEKVFRVRKSSIPAGIKKYRISEGHTADTLVPVKAVIPAGASSVSVERALDSYVTHWNKQQALAGEPYKLSWSHYPADVNLIGFNLELK